jgi:elongation factor Ts
MAEITAAAVKELREKSGAGMMDAKKALVECGGDMEKAIDLLRTKGLAKAEKKSSRTAAEGLVALVTEGTKGVVVEINAETDFVSRNDDFQKFVGKVGHIALKNSHANTEELLAAAYHEGKSVKDELTNLIATVGENMNVRRVALLEVKQGVVAGYVHNVLAPGLGKIGVLVGLESAGDAAKLQALGKQIAMHIAAAFPKFLDVSSVDASELERERNVLKEQAVAQGKAADIAEKMVEGRIRKYYEEVVLLEQIFVVDGETKISKLLENAKADVGAPVQLTGYVRFQLGEGIEKEQEDFAAEVAKVANG